MILVQTIILIFDLSLSFQSLFWHKSKFLVLTSTLVQVCFHRIFILVEVLVLFFFIWISSFNLVFNFDF